MGLLDMFSRKRESTNYTDAVIAGLVSAAEGSNASPESVAATETSAGTWSRALMAARVRPAGAVADVLTPELLGMIARALVRRGEWVAVIDVDRDGAIALMPASSWDVTGNPEPSSWLYRCTLGAPSGTRTVQREAAGVVHVKYGVEPSRPWRGLSPLAFAVSTARLSGGLERGLANEASGPVAHIVPMPQDGGSANLIKLRTDIRAAEGSTILAETTAAGLGEGRAAAPMQDWKPRRLGADFPAANVALRADVEACILAIHGISPSLVQPNADGTAQRESWRRFTFGTIGPVGRLIAHEIGCKLDAPTLALSFDALRAEDIAGRARAYRALVGNAEGANMSDADARRLIGLDDDA